MQNSKVLCDETKNPDKNSANSNDNTEYLIEVSQVSIDDNKLEKQSHSSGGILYNNFSANNLNPNTRYTVTIRRRSGEQLR